MSRYGTRKRQRAREAQRVEAILGGGCKACRHYEVINSQCCHPSLLNDPRGRLIVPDLPGVP